VLDNAIILVFVCDQKNMVCLSVPWTLKLPLEDVQPRRPSGELVLFVVLLYLSRCVCWCYYGTATSAPIWVSVLLSAAIAG
jgi:hypothetical protein